jgi:acyl-CoA synthetase (NDP forming)
LHLFRSLAGCVRAASAYFDYHRFVERYRSPFTETRLDRERGTEADRTLDGATMLLEPEAKQLLSRYGFATGDDQICRGESEVLRAGKTLGFPAVLKVVAADIPHRLAQGLVVLDRRNEAELRAAFRLVSERLATKPASSDGSTTATRFLVSRQERVAFELALGVTRDREFGSVIMLAIGGARIELEPRRVFRVPPLNNNIARDMVEELGVLPILQRVLGRRFDLGQLTTALCSLGALSLELPRVAELDVNPLAVTHDGRLVALDALARMDPQKGS